MSGSPIAHNQGTYRLQVLLDLAVESTSLEGDDLRGGIGIVGNGASTLRAEQPPDGVAGGTLALPLLHGAIDGELILGDDGDESCRRISGPFHGRVRRNVQ